MGVLRSALFRSGAVGAGRQIRQEGRRRALSARRHARRLHRAQRDDHGLSEQFGLGLHRGDHRRPVLASRQHAPLFPAAGELPPSLAVPAALSPHRMESDAARVLGLALDREGDPEGRAERPRPRRPSSRNPSGRRSGKWRAYGSASPGRSAGRAIRTTGGW